MLFLYCMVQHASRAE